MKNNQRAITQLKSWLTASGITTFVEVGAPADFFVLKSDSVGIVGVMVVTDSDKRDRSKVDMVLRAEEVMGRYIHRSIEIFHTLTEAAGYGRPTPTNRGQIAVHPNGLPKNLSTVSDFELVSFRHKELRRVPNPAPEEIAKYHKFLESICWNFIKMNAALCSAVGLEHGDLMTYAMVYTTTFIGLYEKKDADHDENVRLLTTYVRQKLSALKRLSFDKMRSCTPSSDIVDAGVYGNSILAVNQQKDRSIRGFRLSDFERAHEVDMEALIDASRSGKREKDEDEIRIEVTGELRKKLRAMDHDPLVSALKKAAKHRDEEVAKVALHRLDAHEKVCGICSSQGTEQPSA